MFSMDFITTRLWYVCTTINMIIHTYIFLPIFRAFGWKMRREKLKIFFLYKWAMCRQENIFFSSSLCCIVQRNIIPCIYYVSYKFYFTQLNTEISFSFRSPMYLIQIFLRTKNVYLLNIHKYRISYLRYTVFYTRL